MASTSTTWGDGVFGLGADETGLIIESVTHSYSNDQKTLKNRTGNTSSVTHYNEMVKISLDGKIPATSAFSGTIAASIVLGNALGSYLKGGVSGGLTVVDTVDVDMGQEEYRGIKIGATYYPNISV